MNALQRYFSSKILFFYWSYFSSNTGKEVMKMENLDCKKLGILDSDIELLENEIKDGADCHKTVLLYYREDTLLSFVILHVAYVRRAGDL
jgi:hypothetical protein